MRPVSVVLPNDIQFLLSFSLNSEQCHFLQFSLQGFNKVCIGYVILFIRLCRVVVFYVLYVSPCVLVDEGWSFYH